VPLIRDKGIVVVPTEELGFKERVKNDIVLVEAVPEFKPTVAKRDYEDEERLRRERDISDREQELLVETVEVTGMGATPEKAIMNATKEAVRQVVGMYVVAEAAKNRKLIKDEVLSNSNAMVRHFTTIEKGVDEDGIHTITARVEVKVGKVTVRQTQELLTQHS